MDIQPYVDIIIDRFHTANGYSEIDIDKLSRTLFNYLNDIYYKEIEALAIKIDAENELDILPDIERYKREHTDIKTKLLRKAKEISKTSKED